MGAAGSADAARGADASAAGNAHAAGAHAAGALASKSPDELLAEFVSASEAGAGTGGEAALGEAAFGEVVRRYAGMVFATCLRVTKDAHDAEDATQATFLTLAVQCKTGKPVRKLTPWLQQVAKRAALDLRRSRRRRETHEHRHSVMAAHVNGHTNGEPAARAPATGAGASPAAAAVNSTLRSDETDAEKVNKVLAEEVGRLPAKYRLPLVSLYFGGMSRQDVAKELGCTPEALSVRVHRGRQMLGRRLTARGVVVGLLGRAVAGGGGKGGGAALLGGLVSGGVAPGLREAMVARTAEAVARAALGKDLAVSVSAGVLSVLRATAGGVGVLAKLKVPVVLVLLLAAATASAAGGSAKVREAVGQAVRQWSDELSLAPAVKRVMQMLRSPFRAPQASAAGGAGRAGGAAPLTQDDPTGAAPVGGAGRAPTFHAPSGRVPRAHAVEAVSSPRPSPQRPSGPRVATHAPSTATATVRPAPSRRTETPPAAMLAESLPSPRRATPSRAVASAAPQPRAITSAPVPGGNGAPAPPAVPSHTGDVARDPDGQLLSIASAPGSRGDVFLPGGSFYSASQDVGRGGAGRIVQAGGYNFGAALHLGARAGGAGAYDLDDGSFVLVPSSSPAVAQRPGGPAGLSPGVYVGGAGDGVFRFGNDRTSGSVLHLSAVGPSFSFQNGAPFTFDAGRPGPVRGPGGNVLTPAPASDFVVRGDPVGSGTVRGWGGAVGNGGVFVNNGRVIADGRGQDRALIFVGYRSVTSTIDNRTGTGNGNGWFARDGGRLILPKVATGRGTNTYTWGEDGADPTIDLVNSVRFTLRDARHPGKVDVSLLDKTRADVPELPRGHTFIGVWAMDTGLTRPEGGVDLTVRYDDGLARDLGLNENVLKLWQYEGGQWLRINDETFRRDAALNLLSGHAGPGLTHFAVSAPEPSSAAMFMLAGAAILLRRQRRR